MPSHSQPLLVGLEDGIKSEIDRECNRNTNLQVPDRLLLVVDQTAGRYPMVTVVIEAGQAKALMVESSDLSRTVVVDWVE